jgi:hypothetical protein
MSLMETFYRWLRGVPGAPIAPPPPMQPAGIDIEAELAPFVGSVDDLPRTRAEVYKVFGNPGTGKVDPKWERANLVVARGLPGRWNGGAGKLYVHRLAEPYLREALRRAALIELDLGMTALDYIRHLGCFNFRHQRHDPSRPLSYHSWAIAVDMNSADNAGWYVKTPPAPWSAAWRSKYPRGVPEELVRAFESCGWRWGGRWKGFVDPMHFELTAG